MAKMILSGDSPQDKRRMVAASGGYQTESAIKKTSSYAHTTTASVPITKNAQYAGSGANVAMTQPMFFSPLHTPQNWQIASRRREVMQWARFYYMNEPKVAAGVDFYCFTPDNFVLMSDGTEKLIKDIVVGDVVVAGDGSFRKVLETHKRSTKEPILKIKVGGFNREIKVTLGHEIPRVSQTEWIKSLLTTPSEYKKKERFNKFGEIVLKSIYKDADSIDIGDRLFTPVSKVGKGYEDISNDMCYVLGAFLAEGSYYWYKCKSGTKNPKGLRFSINENEINNFGKKIIDILKKECKNDVKIYFQNNEKCVDLVLFDTELSKKVYELVGNGSKTKKISERFINQSNKEQLLSFMAGYIDGDGCFDSRHGCQIRTASDILFSQISFIIEKLGLSFLVFKDEPEVRKVPNGCLSKTKIYSYNIRIVRRDCGIFENYSVFYKKLESKHTKYREVLGIDNKIYRAVTSIVEDFYDGEVYDLTIEGEHSYVVNRITVHNSNFSMNGFKLECKSRKILKYYERLVEKLDLSEKLNAISHEYFLLGDVFPFTEIGCPHCHGSNRTSDGELCNHPDGTFKSIKLMNPDYIDVKDNPIASNPEYYLLPDEELRMLVTRKEPRSAYDALPQSLINLVNTGQPIPLSTRSITHLKHNAADYATYGTSMLQRLFTVLAYKTKMMTANWIVAERLILPIRVVKIGDKERPATDADLQDVQNQLSAVANDPNLTIVTHHAFDYEWYGACYSADTEILTENGWKYFNELESDEMVATYNQESRELEYQFPTEYHEYDFKSNFIRKMFHFNHKSLDIMVTPNHRMLIERKGELKEVYSQDVKHNDKFISTVGWKGEIPVDLPYRNTPMAHLPIDDYLEFVGYYLSEGSLQIERHKGMREDKQIRACYISQSENSLCFDNIESSVEKVYPSYSDHIDSRNKNICHDFVINSVDIARYLALEFGTHSHNKRIPKWIKNLPKDKLKILYDSMMDGDGDIRNNESTQRFRYTTTSKYLAEDMSEVCLKLGFFTNTSLEDYKKIRNRRDIYRIYWSEERRDNKFNIRNQHMKQEDYDGKVYCVKVPNSWLIVRRNGKMSVCGNTGKIHNITQELEEVGKEILDGLMLNQAILNGEMAGYCLSADTTTLCDSGFKYYWEIDPKKDKIACYNPETKKIEYHLPYEKVVYDYEGEMVHFNTDKIDILVTPNHRMWSAKRDSDKYEFTRAEDIRPRARFIGAVDGYEGEYQKSIYIGDEEYSIYDFCKMVGYYVSEGWTTEVDKANRKRKEARVGISQSVNGKARNDISNLFYSMFETHWEEKNQVCVYKPELAEYLKENFGKGFINKKLSPFVKNLSTECLEIVLEAMINGDGCVHNHIGEHRKEKGISYYTSSYQLAEDFAEIAFKCGYVTKIREYNKKESKNKKYFNKNGHEYITRHQQYVVYISKGFKGRTPTLHSKSKKYAGKEITRVPYNGKIYCFSVPHELFVTMRNGMVTIQGNTSAQVGIEVLIRRLDNWRNKLKLWVEKNIFRPVAMMQGFVDEEESKILGEPVYLYPDLTWNDLQLRDKTNRIQTLVQLHDKGLVSAQTLLEELDLDYDSEVEKIREEQIMAQANGMVAPGGDPGGMGGMGGIGGVPMGDMGGAGMPPDMPGEGMGAPGGDMGGGMGAPGGDMGGMGGAPMGASASAELPVIGKRGSKKDKEEEMAPPPQPIKLTTLEQKMYKNLTSMGIPHDLFAQYQVKVPGEARPYSIDFAYPKIGVGIEVDGAIWHERPDFKQRDLNRDSNLGNIGWRILRFNEESVDENMEAVSAVISKHVEEASKQKKSAELNGEMVKYASSLEVWENPFYEKCLSNGEIGCSRGNVPHGKILYIGNVTNG